MSTSSGRVILSSGPLLCQINPAAGESGLPSAEVTVVGHTGISYVTLVTYNGRLYDKGRELKSRTVVTNQMANI